MFTDTQKSKIRLYLGRPDQYRDGDTRLEGILDHLSPEAEVQVTDLLTKLDTVETSILDSGTEGAGIKRVDEIWFDNGWRRSTEIRKLGRIYAGRISVILGVPILCDVFGPGGYLGDSFSGPSRNGLMNLG